MKFRAEVLPDGSVEVPDGVVAALAAGRRLPVRVSINGRSYRGTVVPAGGQFLLASAGGHGQAGAGEEVEVVLEPDTVAREVAVPEDFARALSGPARAAFDALSYRGKQRYVLPVEEAITEKARARRIAKAARALHQKAAVPGPGG